MQEHSRNGSGVELGTTNTLPWGGKTKLPHWDQEGDPLHAHGSQRAIGSQELTPAQDTATGLKPECSCCKTRL